MVVTKDAKDKKKGKGSKDDKSVDETVRRLVQESISHFFTKRVFNL